MEGCVLLSGRNGEDFRRGRRWCPLAKGARSGEERCPPWEGRQRLKLPAGQWPWQLLTLRWPHRSRDWQPWGSRRLASVTLGLPCHWLLRLVAGQLLRMGPASWRVGDKVAGFPTEVLNWGGSTAAANKT